ncbi:MAG: hypothetical protein EXS03_07930 [Phycisphaerales bacterium]|nr:hypothetical protein [Phycisphaerales bacterium]
MTSSGFARWFLGLEAIPSGAQGVEFSWQHPMASWAWFLIMVAAVAIGWWSYRSLMGRGASRVALGVVRAVLITLMAALAAGPLLRLPIVESDPDFVAVLVDRSRSMTIADTKEASGEYSERDSVVRQVLQDPVWRTIDESKEIIWLGFHASAFDLNPSELPPPDGWSTDLTIPIETALRRLAGRPASAIVVVSDGRTARPMDQHTLRAISARAIPVFTVALGSAVAMTDLSVAEADAPQRAFVRDQVPVVVRVECAGGTPGSPVQIELVDAETLRIIDSVELTPDKFTSRHAEAVLTGAHEEAGQTRWIVRVHGSGDDLVKANDEQTIEIDFIDRPLRVLYIEGYPRWEYRYLKNLLVREPSLESSVMLLSADRDFAQEGNAPLERLPQTADEFAEFDLFILGDVPSGSLSQTQIANIASSVSDRGAGLLWIAGERSTPGSWRSTELEDLLPLRGVPERFDEVVIIEPTPGAQRSGVLQLGETPRERWPDALTETGGHAGLEWAQRIEVDSLKPASEVLAVARPLSSSQAYPLAVTMRYGAGVVLYVGTDETWRWRHGIGETYQERFWIQFIRYLSRGSVQRDDKPFQLIVEPRQPEVGVPAMIRVEVQETKAGDVAGDAPLEVRADPIDAGQGASGETTQLIRDGGQWVNGWTPLAAGAWRIRVDSPRTGVLEQVVTVVRSDAELLTPETDHAQLAELALRTGGAVVAPGDLRRLLDLLPRRSLTKEQAIIDPIWNSPAALTVVLALLLAEWIGRRWLRLA